MTAQIAKNKDFETIGFEVKSNGLTIFQWGVAPLINFHYVKNIDVKDFETEIINIIRLREESNTLGRFASQFFEVCANSKDMQYPDKGVNFSVVEEKIKSVNEKIINIIKNIN